ncbi:MAG: ABC transporter ATP-binding protein [Cryobacterium sp.]
MTGSAGRVAVLSVEHLTKSFGRVRAVDDLSFEVEAGSVFAFLGTNGAGKSTTISCMTTTLRADAGTIMINGNRVGGDDARIKADIGVVFQDSVLDPLLTPRENLRLRAGLYGVLSESALKKRIDELVAVVDLEGFLDRRYGTLSGGQKRRTDMARALLHHPSVLFLDEPTAGLDPHSRENVWSAIAELRESEGLTVFLTTHYMEEAENAGQVLIIEQGRAVASGTPLELRGRYSSTVVTIRLGRTVDTAAVDAALAALGLNVTRSDLTVSAEVAGTADALRLVDRLRDQIEDLEIRNGTMDQVFLRVTTPGAGL